MDGCRWSIQGVLSQYDISDLEQIELCKIRTSGQYLANFHQYEFYCIAIPLHSTNFIPIAHTSGNRTSGDRTSGGPPVKSQKLDHRFETSQSYFIQLHTLTATMICKLRKFKVVKFNITDVFQAQIREQVLVLCIYTQIPLKFQPIQKIQKHEKKKNPKRKKKKSFFF